MAAQTLELTWSLDQEPGIIRRRSGRGFSYRTPDGSAPRKSVVQRIKSLAIPPAWTDVWISTEEHGHIQATGRDARGRKQYIYHPRWREVRDEAKFSRMSQFGKALPAIREKVARDLARRSLSHERVVAGVVRMLDLAAVRVGSDQYAKENKSFGLTTLLCRHVTVLGESVRLQFNGKGGKKHRVEVCDRRVARVIRDCTVLPGQSLFQYVGEDGERDRVRSQDVNEYLRAASGGSFSAKDFRTWTASVNAAQLLAELSEPSSKAEATRQENMVTDQVAECLGNTRSICRKCYIYPGVYEAYRDGSLQQAWQRNQARWSREGDGAERLLLWLLRQQAEALRG